MCLIACAWRAHPRWRLILLGNRDEAHARPSAPLGSWTDAPAVLAGRDLESGGTWMGVDRSGRVGVVTNVRDPGADLSGRSRGHLVADYLRGADALSVHAGALLGQAAGYRPFNLLLFDAQDAVYVGNHPEARMQWVSRGVHGLSNADFDEPWPKTSAIIAQLQAWLDAGHDDDFEPLFTALADDSPWPDNVLPDTGVGIELERHLSATFIRGQRFGTRASTIIAVDNHGAGVISERRFGPNGVALGAATLHFGAEA